MNYTKQYHFLIERAKTRTLAGYKENHHIIPRCIGGTDDPTNLVNLTAREHYIAHIFLAKIYGGKLWHAVNMMGRIKRYSNRHYEKARLEHSKLLSEQNKRTKTKPKEDRTYKCVICNGIFVRLEFCHHLIKSEFVCGHRCNGARNGKKTAGKKNTKLSESMMGRVAWNKGLPSPTSAENGKKSAVKLSATVTGRKKKILPDGTWTWEYPNK
jgi:hypothetical protein